ncbi:hypothetical protein [Nocardia abscessus]|uniref:hypothetical protein n=1 Tax=Nocardia abscessus TaxID=120957 RepID=UPI002458594D|nr:hypothetical protein [Nocardia abscessus]
MMPVELDEAAWDHLFRPSTYVRPWTFRDLSGAPIYSYPVRFVCAYLTAVYRTVGRAHPTDPPTPGDLAALVDTLGPLTDTRVDAEREPPPREPVDIPLPKPPPKPEPRPGCLRLLYRLLRRFCRPLRWLGRLIRRTLGIPRFWQRPRPIRSDRPSPKIEIPRTVHRSPYGAEAPLEPAHLPALEELERQMTAAKVIAPANPVGSMDDALAARNITFDFARVKRFYERPESAIPDPNRPEVPQLDFHQALAALGDYPALLRTLGIVIRLRTHRPATNPDTVRVIPLWDGKPRATDVSPATHVTVGSDSCTAANRPGSDLHGGLLDLRGANDRLTTDAPKFDVVQIDSDGSAIKAMNLAATVARRNQLTRRGELGIDRPTREALAALRSGGLAIVRPDRAYHLHQRLLAALNLSIPRPADTPEDPATLPTDLFAEDLLRGYRVEVSTDDGPWQSLGRRIGTYRLVDDDGATVHTLPAIHDEGYVKATSGTRTAGPGNPLYVHEALVRWTGWSLTAPRPGKTIENHLEGPPPGEPYDRPMLPKSTAVTEFRLVTSFVPQPGSLPRLRFGHSYRFRMHAVDLAGEPIAAPGTDPATSDPVIFRRFEPVGPPAILPLRPFLPGESLEHMVLRSDFDRANPDFDRVWGADPADAVAQRTRHLFPPKTSQQMAELHGRFDMALGATGDPDAGYRLALRESGSLTDQNVIDVHADFDVDNPQATIPAGEPEPVTPTDPDAPGGYWINRRNTTLPTPYLPDPLAAGVALRGLPGLFDPMTGETRSPTGDPLPPVVPGRPPLLQIPFTGTWPDLKPLRLMVAEPPPDDPRPPPHWDDGHRLLTVFLPQATQARVLYSSYVGPPGLDLHGMWDIIDDGDAAGSLRGQAESGAHWMISAPRALTLLHAVQRPLTPARLEHLKATRVSLGETGARLTGFLRLNVASTSRIDIIGRWDEWLDDEEFCVAQHPREAVAFGMTVRADWPDHDNFPQPANRSYHEFGDTRHRRVRYLVRATSRFREYMQPNMDLVRDTDEADVSEVSVLSSARPDRPGVLYAVPSFRWHADEFVADGRDHDIIRHGGSLRVYLARPWYSSGEGELLGLVLQAKEQNKLPDSLRTRYGADAIWAGSTSQSHSVGNLEPHHFRNKVATETGLSLPGLPGLTATVVAFQPECDRARKLWYADIELDLDQLPWNYWPFIRMAFVRYQPDSLPRRGPRQPDDTVTDVKLSDVVLGEFGQLAPDRTLSLIRDAAAPVVRATLRGNAPSYPAPPRVAFRVQTTRVTDRTPDELDWEHNSGHPVDVDRNTFFEKLVPPADTIGDHKRVWEADVELPPAREDERMRLEVAEYEILRADDELGGALTRMTYAAHVDLD